MMPKEMRALTHFDVVEARELMQLPLIGVMGISTFSSAS
jgi:hypothetical protein